MPPIAKGLDFDSTELKNSAASSDSLGSKTRVQLDLAPSQVRRLIWVMEACNLETRKDLFNTALTLLEWAVLEVVKGRSVASVDREAKHIVELAMPALSDAAQNAKRMRSVETAM